MNCPNKIINLITISWCDPAWIIYIFAYKALFKMDGFKLNFKNSFIANLIEYLFNSTFIQKVDDS